MLHYPKFESEGIKNTDAEKFTIFLSNYFVHPSEKVYAMLKRKPFSLNDRTLITKAINARIPQIIAHTISVII